MVTQHTLENGPQIARGRQVATLVQRGLVHGNRLRFRRKMPHKGVDFMVNGRAGGPMRGRGRLVA